jgi:hypothetical protein
MGEETARLREEIDRTREDLTRDVDRLADKTSPSRMLERRVQRARRGLTGWKEKVMGSSGFEHQSRYGPTYTHSGPGSGVTPGIGQAIGC